MREPYTRYNARERNGLRARDCEYFFFRSADHRGGGPQKNLNVLFLKNFISSTTRIASAGRRGVPSNTGDVRIERNENKTDRIKRVCDFITAHDACIERFVVVNTNDIFSRLLFCGCNCLFFLKKKFVIHV